MASTRVTGLETSSAGAGLRALKVLEAVPLALEDGAIKFDVDGRGKTRLPFSRIEAIAVAAVGGLSARPVLVIDCVLNWSGSGDEPLKVIRTRSDRFNPTTFMPGEGTPVQAIKAFIQKLLDGSGATPLPDVGVVVGAPFSSHADVSDYQSSVLLAQ